MIRTLLLIIILPMISFGQEEKNLNEKFEMKEYYLVFLKEGSHRNQDSATAADIQSRHLEYLTKMYDDDKMSICGPLMDENDIKGMCVYHVGSIDEAKRLAEDDPAVKSGRLIVEVHPWYSAKGMILK